MSRATTLKILYLGAIVSGIGAGAVYGSCVGNSLKWFPDRRGLAAGLTAAGFGAGSALTVLPIQTSIRIRGYRDTFHIFGLGQGGVVMMMAAALSTPASSVSIRGVAVRDVTP